MPIAYTFCVFYNAFDGNPKRLGVIQPTEIQTPASMIAQQQWLNRFPTMKQIIYNSPNLIHFLNVHQAGLVGPICYESKYLV